MKHLLKSNFLILMLWMLVSCGTPSGRQLAPLPETTSEPFKVPEFVENQVLDTSILSSVRVIPLETHAHSILQHIDVIEFGEKYMYILDKRQECIFIFDKTGRFINKIARKGRGPKEYYYIKDFRIDEQTDLIEIYDHKKLIRYNIKGDFLTAIQVPFYASNFVRTPKGYIFFTDNYCNKDICDNIIFCDSELNILATALPIQDNLKDLQHSDGRRLYKSATGQISLVGYDDRIYILSDSSIIRKEKVSVEGSVTPDAFYQQDFKSLNDYVLKLLNNPTASYIGNYLENDYFLSFVMHQNKFTYTYLYDKIEGTKKSYRKIESELLNQRIKGFYKDRIYTFLEASNLRTLNEQKLNAFDQGIVKQYETLLKKIRVNDNPIIISYKVQ